MSTSYGNGRWGSSSYGSGYGGASITPPASQIPVPPVRITNGWGVTPYGGSSWGGVVAPTFGVTNVSAVSENQLQVEFSAPIYISGLLDVPDGSSRKRYMVTPQASTGRDGTAARPVSVISVATVSVPGTYLGQVVVLTLDRPMTPYPAVYAVTVNGIYTADLSKLVDPSSATGTTFATYRALVTPSLDTSSSNRGDFANPQLQSAAVAAGIPSALGTFGVDETGDYASDSGIQSYKKRVLRRLVALPGSFAHLGNGFGAGVPTYGRKLATAQKRAELIANVESQIAQDPETQSVKASVVPTSSATLFRLQVVVVTKSGQSARFGVPIAP